MAMLKPFYQGKIDTFCAIYAVLNGLRLTHGIRTLKARDIFNDTLMELAARPDTFRDVLTQNTDYLELVDGLLNKLVMKMPLEVIRPFAANVEISPGKFWDTCAQWLGNGDNRIQGRAVVFRFLRHMSPEKPPLNRHWTTADSVNGDILHLFDCSHEAEAILNIRKDSFVTAAKNVDATHLLYIQPHTARFLRLPF